jgi:hypothetical protein
VTEMLRVSETNRNSQTQEHQQPIDLRDIYLSMNLG